jgi:hypothetical protein
MHGGVADGVEPGRHRATYTDVGYPVHIQSGERNEAAKRWWNASLQVSIAKNKTGEARQVGPYVRKLTRDGRLIKVN